MRCAVALSLVYSKVVLRIGGLWMAQCSVSTRRADRALAIAFCLALLPLLPSCAHISADESPTPKGDVSGEEVIDDVAPRNEYPDSFVGIGLGQSPSLGTARKMASHVAEGDMALHVSRVVGSCLRSFYGDDEEKVEEYIRIVARVKARKISYDTISVWQEAAANTNDYHVLMRARKDKRDYYDDYIILDEDLGKPLVRQVMKEVRKRCIGFGTNR